MRHAVMLAVVLLPSLALAQVPAPVGGDMSNTTTKATGGTTARKLADRAADTLNPLDFGAIGDGASHLLTTGGALLAECPQLTAPVETDACAVQAAINVIAAKPVTAGVPGTPGGTIKVPANTILKMGTQSLTANLIGLTWAGEDQWTSTLLVGANPMLNFGLSNGMGIGVANVASTGAAFAVGDTLTINTTVGGTCSVAPIITVTSVGPTGNILTSVVNTGDGGNCSALPPSPLAYDTNGIGYGASFNGVWTGSALTAPGAITQTGSGCVNGEVLTGVGGTTPGGTPRPLKLTVTNAVAGAIQQGGVTITDAGSYGTPPPNAVTVTASGACSGATFNVGRMTNSGGIFAMERLQLVADAPGVSVAKAQFNMSNRSTIIRDLVLFASGANYFSGGFDLTSVTNGVFQRIDTSNNQTFLNSNPSSALFVIRQQNNLLGHFEHYWDHISAYAFTGGAIDYLSTAVDTVPFQGLKFLRVGCSLGLHCLRLENTGTRSYGNVYIDDLFATQNVQQIEITKGLGVIITNSGFGEGNTRVTSPPSQADMVVLDSVNQWQLRGNSCSSARYVTPSITCFHIKGTSGFGMASSNAITNAAHVPTFNGFVFDAGTSLNQEQGDYFGAFVTPVIDNGISNTTVKSPMQPPCLDTGVLTTGATYTVPNGNACVYFSGTSIAALTLVMPASPTPNQVINFTSFGTITTLTVQANTGQAIGTGMPTTISGGTPFAVKAIGLRWQRI